MVSIEVERETGVAIAVGSGVLGIKEAQDSVVALWRNPEWPGESTVWDFREAQFDVSPPEARALARFVLLHQRETPPSRVAWVTGRVVDFGMARMFEAYRQDPRTEFRVFRDYDQALIWAREVESNAT